MPACLTGLYMDTVSHDTEWLEWAYIHQNQTYYNKIEHQDMTVPVQYYTMYNELSDPRFLGKFLIQVNGVRISCDVSKFL